MTESGSALSRSRRRPLAFPPCARRNLVGRKTLILRGRSIPYRLVVLRPKTCSSQDERSSPSRSSEVAIIVEPV